MGLGIAFVSAVHARVPVLIHDRSPEQVKKGIALFDKLLAKDVSKGKLTETEAKEARDRVQIVDSISKLEDVDMCVEVSYKENHLSACALNMLHFPLGCVRALSVESFPVFVPVHTSPPRCNSRIQYLFYQHHENRRICYWRGC